MKRICLAVFAAVVVSLVAWAVILFASPRETYHPRDVTILAEGVTDDGPQLVFRVPLETMFYCPGARHRIEGTAIHYEVVRSSIESEPLVDAKAVQREDGSLRVTFPFPSGSWRKGDVFELVDSTGKRRGQRRNTGPTQEASTSPVGPEVNELP
jgi:hypothetical protein